MKVNYILPHGDMHVLFSLLTYLTARFPLCRRALSPLSCDVFPVTVLFTVQTHHNSISTIFLCKRNNYVILCLTGIALPLCGRGGRGEGSRFCFFSFFFCYAYISQQCEVKDYSTLNERVIIMCMQMNIL